MTEPAPLPEAQAARPSLWSAAPGWRNLTLTAVFLTAAAIALPLALPQDPSDSAGHSPAAAPAPPSGPPSHASVAPTVVTPAPAEPARAAQPPPQIVYVPKYVPVPAPAAPAPAPAPAPLPVPAAPDAQLAAKPQAGALPAPETVGCTLRGPPAPRAVGAGTVMGFENQATSLARIQLTEQHAGGKIDPAYIDNLRAQVRMDNGRGAIFVVPRSMPVQIGDRVTVQSGYRNVQLPCNYIPNLITADLGPAAPPPPVSKAP